MSDLINRQDAIDALKEKVFHNLSYEFYGAMQVLDELPSAQPEPIKLHAYAMTEEEIKNLKQEINDLPIVFIPSAQPERKRGEWIVFIDDLFPIESYMKCSVCEHEQPLTIDDNYCPNCGARMDERREGEQ